MSITWKQARDLIPGDRAYLRPLGGPDEVLAVFHETSEGSKVETLRAQVADYGFVVRGWWEMVAVTTS